MMKKYIALILCFAAVLALFGCSARQNENVNGVFYAFTDSEGREHILPGQVRVAFDGDIVRRSKGKLKFIEILETAKLNVN